MFKRRVVTEDYPTFEEKKMVVLYAQLNDDVYDGVKTIKLENGRYLTVPEKIYPKVTKEDIAKFEYTLTDESLEGEKKYEERISVLEEILSRLLYNYRKENDA